MYNLVVYYPGEDVPRERRRALSALEVLEKIPALLAEHDRCEHVVVMLGQTRLFAVDCEGKRLP